MVRYPAHDIPQFDCMDCRSIATLRQAAEGEGIEVPQQYWWTRWSHMSNWY
jgi:hypothetical protein